MSQVDTNRIDEIYPIISKMGGWANFSYHVKNHMLENIVVIKKLSLQKQIAKEALEFVVKNSGTSCDYNVISRKALESLKE